MMLFSLLGNFFTPIVATAMENGEGVSTTASEKTINSTSGDTPKTLQTESVPPTKESSSTEESIPVENHLQFDQASEFVDTAEKNELALNLVGNITSSTENNQAITFEMAKLFVLKDAKDEEKNILNDQKEIIGKYTVDTTKNGTQFTLDFNKLSKGDNRFRLVLLGTNTRGPNRTVDFYQKDKKIFQLNLPKETESTTQTIETKETSTENSQSDTQTTATTERTKNASSNQSKNVNKAVLSPETKSEDAGATQDSKQMDELFEKYAPGDNFVKKIKLTTETNPATIDSVVVFQLDFEIPDTVRTEMMPGDYYEMDFPQGLEIRDPSPKGDLLDKNKNSYGTYEFDANTQKLRIVFTKQDSMEFLPASSGSVSADVHFDKKKITQPGETTITYPSKTNIPPATFIIKPSSGASLSKAGHPDRVNSPDKVIWDIDFNKDYSDLSKPLIREHFPDQLVFDKQEKGAVSVYPLNLDFDGNVVGVDTIPLDPKQYTVENDGSIQFNMAIQQPYRIVYTTTIKDSVKPSDGGKLTIGNNVELITDTTNLQASASVDLTYEKALEKVKTDYDPVEQVYSWLIRYNYGQKELTADNVISDTYSANMDVDPDSFAIYQVNFDSDGTPVNGAPIDPSAYTIDTTNNPFKVTFKNNVQAEKAINITYKTKVNKIVTDNSGIKITNQARTENLSSSAEVQANPTQQVIIKHKPTLDVGRKSAHYVVDINKNKYELENALFTDTMSYTDEGYVIFPTKVKVPDKQSDYGVIIRDVSENDHILTGAVQFLDVHGNVLNMIGDETTADYVLSVHLTESQKGYTDFKIKFQNSYAKTRHQFQMEYYVSYNQFNEEFEDPNTSINYANTIKVNFDNNGESYEASSSAEFKTNTQETQQGMKFGSYDPATKEFTWTIVTNYNNLGVSRIYFHDPITGNQVYEPNSLEVTRGTINHNGQFQATTSDSYKGNQVGKNYLKVTDPAPTSENQGTLTIDLGTDEEYIQGWNVTGAPMVFQIQFKTSLKNQIVYDQSTYSNVANIDVKGIKQDLPASVSVAFGGQSILKDGKYNAQTGKVDWQLVINPNQSWLSNVKVEDKPSANQFIKASSFKLYTGKYSGTGSSITVEPDQPVPTNQYKVQIDTDSTVGQQTFTVDMSGIKEKKDPNHENEFLNGVIEKPYVLVYETEPNFTSKTETVTNDAIISSEGAELPGKDTNKDVQVTIQESDGLAYGTKGKIIVQKENGQGGVVPNAVLQLLRKNTKTNQSDIIYQVTTDKQGMAIFGNLIATSPIYEYSVKEIEAPEGYTISPELLVGKKVSINTDSTPLTTLIKNEPIKLIFNKTDGEGKPLSGRLFSLLKNKGTKEAPNYVSVQTFAARERGVDLSGLSDGQYQISESMAPEGYQINQTPIDFEVKKNADNTRNVFVNDQVVSDGVLTLKNYQGSAVLKKTDEAGKTLAGAQFNLQHAKLNTGDFSDYGNQKSYITDNNGQLNLTGLAPGKYKLKESKAPEGYYLNTEEIAFEIPQIATGNEAPIQLNDGKALINYQGTAIVTKKSESGELLRDAIFEVQTSSGKTVQTNLVTDENGKVAAKNLAPGAYQFVETKAPNGYMLNTQPLPFTIDTTSAGKPAAVTANFVNYQGGVELIKIDAEDSNKYLANAEFQLLDSKETVLRKELKTNGEGKLALNDLAPGKYFFKETKAPEGYQLLDKLVGFTIPTKHNGKPKQMEVVVKNSANTPSRTTQSTKPDQSIKPDQSTKHQQSGKGYYPKTGETKSMIMIIGGVILVLVIIGATYLRRKQHEK